MRCGKRRLGGNAIVGDEGVCQVFNPQCDRQDVYGAESKISFYIIK